MISYRTKLFVGGIATAILLTFVLGLAHSISTGFAGFWGGLPFWIIALFVMALAVYDYWDSCIRQK
ncbi:MAG: hypothetical protein ACR2O3_15935 [Rhizobiaceae bacterium]